jgi:Fe-S cluster assembly ATPase SufC
MPNYQVTVSTPLPSGFAVDSVRGMFDIATEKIAKQEFKVELPATEELIEQPDGAAKPWRIGVIVGPSGSGKTTVARHAYGERFSEGGFEWDSQRAVVDHFPGVPLKEVTQTLTSVGFSSPPAWLKPHQVLSGGERFRCDLARALLGTAPGLVAFDEFTSVVDRTVAKVGSAAIAKGLRKGRFDAAGQARQFVAVTCHYDVLDWLEPDWVLDMSSQQLARGRLRCSAARPEIALEVAPIRRTAWELFRRHHYLNTNLASHAKCFAAFLGDEPVAFSAWVHRMSRGRQVGDMREHRTVVLPDFQGIGVGNRVSELCASYWLAVGRRAFSTTSHPGMIHYRHASPRWHTVRFGMVAPTGGSGMMRRVKSGAASELELARVMWQLKSGKRAADSCGRVTGGFQFIGPPLDAAIAANWHGELPNAIAITLADGAAVSPAIIARRLGLSVGFITARCDEMVAAGQLERLALAQRRRAYSLSALGRRLLGERSQR